MNLIDTLLPANPPEIKNARIASRWTATGRHESSPASQAAAKKQAGEKNPSAKLSDEKVRQILALADRREVLKKELADLSNVRIAKLVGVADSTVGKVIAGKSWRHLK